MPGRETNPTFAMVATEGLKAKVMAFAINGLSASNLVAPNDKDRR